jgi:hypothetical protein
MSKWKHSSIFKNCIEQPHPPFMITRQIKGQDSMKEKVLKSKIKIGMPFMVPGLVYKFQTICLREIYAIEWNPK